MVLLESGRNFGFVIGRTTVLKDTVVLFWHFCFPRLLVKLPVVLELNTASWKDSRDSFEVLSFLNLLFFVKA